MALRPQSCVQEDDLDFDPSSHLIPSFTRESSHERMLAGEAIQPTRPAYVLDNIEALPSYGPPVNYPRSYDNMLPSHRQDPNSGPEDEASNSKIPRSAAYKGTLSSPLNPMPSMAPPIQSPFSRPGSRGSTHFTRIPSEVSRVLASGSPSTTPLTTRGSMILYRKVETQDDLSAPQPPYATYNSTAIDSVPLSSDSKYPVGAMTSEHGLVAYAWDPLVDDPIVEEDELHDPEGKTTHDSGRPLSFRGFINIAMLIVLLSALLSLFVMYPVYRHYNDNGRNELIVGNTRINSTGQATSTDFDPRSQISILPLSVVIDPATPQEALTRRSQDGVTYDLVFSDEFNTDGRSFYKNDDPFWEGGDDQMPDHRLITTQNGYLVLKSRAVPIRGFQAGTQMGAFLKQRISTCLDGGFVEVSVASPSFPVDKHLMWTGSWISADIEPPPQGISLSETVSLQLLLDSGPVGMLAIDFVRYYQRAGSLRQSCGDTQLQILGLSRNDL